MANRDYSSEMGEIGAALLSLPKPQYSKRINTGGYSAAGNTLGKSMMCLAVRAVSSYPVSPRIP